jgi:hypothetical protein
MGARITKPDTRDSKSTNQKGNISNRQDKKSQSSNMASNDNSLQEVELKKYHAGCTGMFWRSDPTGKTSLQSNDNWPRDGAKLRGTVVTVKGEKWLLATHILQRGDTEWKAAPKGAAMPFEYNAHYFLE